MSIEEHGRKRRARIARGSAAFLMGVFLFNVWATPAFSQAGRPVITFSVVTFEQGQSLEGLAKKYNTTTSQILKDNAFIQVKPGVTLTIRENTVTNTGSSRGTTTVSWHWPVSGPISSDYGWRGYKEFHHGIDIAVPSGTDIQAAHQGKVVRAGWLGVYGLALLIDHGNGVQTLYGHNQKLLVKVGERVEVGEKIAISGNTGNTTGPHLHFEVRLNGKTVNPNQYLPQLELAQSN
jgi:murein DD-endopeptidase MepM/ murein hydrolase activator NlpD